MGADGGLVIGPGGNVLAAGPGRVVSVLAGDQSVTTVLDNPGIQFRGLSYSPNTNTLLVSAFDKHEIVEVELGASPPAPQIFAGAALNRLNGPYGSVVSATDFQPFISPLFVDDDNDGVLYNDFDTGGGSPDNTKWNWWGNGVIDVTGGGLRMFTQPNVGSGDVTVSAVNPGAIESLSADVTINSISSGTVPRARISGYRFNLYGYDVFAAIHVRTHLITSVRLTFRWDAVPGAQRYRVRIYNYGNTQTILRAWVDGATTYTVPTDGLQSNAYYRFRLDAVDAPSGQEPGNYSRTPATGGEFYRFYTGLPGDVDGDGFVDMADAIETLKGCAAQGGTRLHCSGDVNADERIGGAEALLVLQDAAGLR